MTALLLWPSKWSNIDCTRWYFWNFPLKVSFSQSGWPSGPRRCVQAGEHLSVKEGGRRGEKERRKKREKKGKKEKETKNCQILHPYLCISSYLTTNKKPLTFNLFFHLPGTGFEPANYWRTAASARWMTHITLFGHHYRNCERSVMKVGLLMNLSHISFGNRYKCKEIIAFEVFRCIL